MAKASSTRVNEAESKQIMNSLFDDLDQNDALEEHADHARQAIDEPISFNKQEAVMQQYAMPAPTTATAKQEQTSPLKVAAANPFAKKRTADQITTHQKADEQAAPDIEMAYEPQVTQAEKQDESMATSNFHSAIDDSKMLEVGQRPSDPTTKKEATIEEEWEKLKIQNQLLNGGGALETAKLEVQASLSGSDLPLPLNPDGSLNFFYVDAHEEPNGSDVYLFGKVWQP